jgi:hypothetical protein
LPRYTLPHSYLVLSGEINDEQPVRPEESRQLHLQRFFSHPSTMPEAQYVTIDTSVGSFTLELYTAHAPKVCCLAERFDW